MNKQETRLIKEFIEESNHIEGINREPTIQEIEEFTKFLSLEVVHLENLVDFVKVYQPDARLRDLPHLNVRIGTYIPPRGGHLVVSELERLLDDVEVGNLGSYQVHQRYERLHPFTDGNGRSGRALWAWQQFKKYGYRGLSLKFLQRWYYQSLSEERL